MESHSQDVTAVTEQLRSQDIDVVRVSYSDMIGVDRGRDVLLYELPAALGARPRVLPRIFHTSPMGETVPVQGGIEDGLPDVIVRPDLSTLAPLPWEPDAPGLPGRRLPRRRHARAGVAPDRGQPGRRAPRAARAAGHHRPGARVLRLRAERRDADRLHRYADEPGQRLRGRPQGRPARACCCTCPALPARRRAAGDRGQPRVLARPVRDQPRPLRAGRRRRPLVPAEVRRAGDRPAPRACWPRSWPSRSTTRAGPGSTCTSR